MAFTPRAAGLLVPTAVQTSSYTPNAGDFVIANTTTAAQASTLPSAPANGAQVAFLLQASSTPPKALTVTAGSGDTLDTTVTGVLSVVGEELGLQYVAATKTWEPFEARLSLLQLDGRYAPPLADRGTYAAGAVIGAGLVNGLDGNRYSVPAQFTATATSATVSALQAFLADVTAGKLVRVAVIQVPVFPGTGGLVPVAQGANAGAGTASVGSDTIALAGAAALPGRSWDSPPLTVLYNTPVLVFEYTNGYAGGGVSGDVDGPSAITFRLGVDLNATTTVGTNILPVKWRGLDTVVIPPGGTVVSDPVYGDFLAGQQYFLRPTITMASGTTYVYNGTAGRGYAFSPAQDNSRSGTNYSGGGNQSFMPTRILGLPSFGSGVNYRFVALVGDSIMQGANATLQFYGGGFEQALVNQKIGFVKIAKGGESASGVTGTAIIGVTARFARLVGCTDAIVEYGTNDLQAGQTAAQLQASLTVIYARLRRLGIKRIYQTTITPRATSTDSFTTAAGQTPIAGFGPGSAQATINALIRGGFNGLIDGFIDVESVCTAVVGSGVYLTEGRNVTDAVTTAATTSLTSATAAFTAADSGKKIVVAGAGASGANLSTTMTFVNATTVTLAAAATTAVSGATANLRALSYTVDGVHPEQSLHNLIAGIVPNFTVAA